MLPWAEMFNAALARGVMPSAFWSLSLREWFWLVGAGSAPLSRDAFETLMRNHPDG